MPSPAQRRAALALAPVRIRIGPCMSGLLKPGDEALLEPCDVKALKAGDLVALDTPEGPKLHRYLGARRTKGGIRLLTKGDRGVPFDRALPPDALLGRISAIRRDGRLLKRPRGIPARELPAVAASLARGLIALARRKAASL